LGASVADTIVRFTTSLDASDNVAQCAVRTASHTAVVCGIPEGAGAATVRVTVAGQSSGTLAFEYAVPEVTRILGCDPSPSSPFAVVECPIVGGDVITVAGSNFGSDLTASASVEVGGLPCTNVTHTVPHLNLTCRLPTRLEGGFELTVAVSVAGQTGEGAGLLSYQGPEIFPGTLFFVGGSGESGPLNVSALDATDVIGFRGKNFGSVQGGD
jgi:hypothetical protein